MAERCLPEDWQAVASAIAEVEAKTLLFVTGSVKAGTTWTQLWLDRHPEVACRGEGYFFNKFAGALQKLCMDSNAMVSGQNLYKGDGPPPFPPISTPHIVHLLRQSVLGCLATYGADPAIKIVGEKTPSTVLALETVFVAFPDARVLHCARDGRDMAISAWHDNLRKAGDEFLALYPTFGTFLPEIAAIWVNHQTPILKAKPDRGDQIHVIHYEDLVSDASPILRAVFDWLKVDASQETIAACVAETRFEKLAAGRKPGDTDNASFFRKGTAGQWRDDMTVEQQATFWGIAGETMLEMGYDKDGRIRA